MSPKNEQLACSLRSFAPSGWPANEWQAVPEEGRKSVSKLDKKIAANAVALSGHSICAGLGGYPFVASLTGRHPLSAEIFGLAPDPTALATLALFALADGRGRWPLLMLPLIWCLVSDLTLWTMGAGDFFVAPACALIAVAIAVRTR